MWKYYNPNPDGKAVGDCVIRAICKATGQDWEETYAKVSAYGFSMHDMPSSNVVWGAYLKSIGYRRKLVDEYCTVKEFCEAHPVGTFILSIDGHVVCVASGDYYDSWDSGNEIPIFYWVKE